jgi:cysteine-rich repeat protein
VVEGGAERHEAEAYRRDPVGDKPGRVYLAPLNIGTSEAVYSVLRSQPVRRAGGPMKYRACGGRLAALSLPFLAVVSTSLEGCCDDCDRHGVCGDGIHQWPEECDDGNAFEGDECNSNCRSTLRDFMHLRPKQPSTGALFGASIKVSAGRLAVGAPGEGLGAGAVYLFGVPSGGSLPVEPVSRVEAPNPVAGDDFGASLTLMGAHLAVGANSKNVAGNGSGAAYAFDTTDTTTDPWSSVGLVSPPDLVAGDAFGQTMAMDDDALLVSSPGRARSASDAGVVDVFHRAGATPSSWNWVATIAPSPPTLPLGASEFGIRLAVENGVAAVVGTETPLGEASVPIIYIFQATDTAVSDWQFVEALSSDAQTPDDFGKSIVMTSTCLAVGAPSAADGRGTVHLYARGSTTPVTWLSVTDLVPEDPHDYRQFGSSLAVVDGYLAVAADAPTGLRPERVVYVFSFGGDCAVMSQIGTTRSSAVSFGKSLAVTSTAVFVGVDDSSGEGAVYTFEFAGVP